MFNFQTADFGLEPPPRQRILVVENEGDLRQLNAEVLIDAGYRVDVADDGATAWAALQASPYDLLITDEFLPKLSGAELLTKMHETRMPLAVIMVTEILPTWEAALHPCLQAVTMLRKPYTLGKFVGVVKSVLAKTTPVAVGIAPWQHEPEALILRSDASSRPPVMRSLNT